MPANLSAGAFRIISLTEGNGAASVNQTFIAFQPVRLGEFVQTWRVQPVGDNIYRLSVGGYPYTEIDGDKVIATIHPERDVEWHITYREYNDAYTIEPAEDQSKGWTVPPDFSINPVIEIKPIISTKSIPPQFIPAQLWRFEPVN